MTLSTPDLAVFVGALPALARAIIPVAGHKI